MSQIRPAKKELCQCPCSTVLLLRDEFLNLYTALFKHADYHIEIIRTLASKPNGLSRTNLIKYSKLTDSGRITKVLMELSESGFITAYPAFGKKKKGGNSNSSDGNKPKRKPHFKGNNTRSTSGRGR